MIAFLPRDSTNYCIPRCMAQLKSQRHQTLFPRRTSGHAHQHGEKGSGSRDYHLYHAAAWPLSV